MRMILLTWELIVCSEFEFNEFKPRLKTPKNRFNLETWNTILKQLYLSTPRLKFFKFGHWFVFSSYLISLKAARGFFLYSYLLLKLLTEEKYLISVGIKFNFLNTRTLQKLFLTFDAGFTSLKPCLTSLTLSSE